MAGELARNCVSAIPVVQGKGNENRNRVIPILNNGHQIMVSRMNELTNIESQTDYVDRFSAMRPCRIAAPIAKPDPCSRVRPRRDRIVRRLCRDHKTAASHPATVLALVLVAGTRPESNFVARDHAYTLPSQQMNPYVAQWALRFGWLTVLYHQPKWLPTSLGGFAETEEYVLVCPAEELHAIDQPDSRCEHWSCSSGIDAFEG